MIRFVANGSLVVIDLQTADCQMPICLYWDQSLLSNNNKTYGCLVRKDSAKKGKKRIIKRRNDE